MFKNYQLEIIKEYNFQKETMKFCIRKINELQNLIKNVENSKDLKDFFAESYILFGSSIGKNVLDKIINIINKSKIDNSRNKILKLWQYKEEFSTEQIEVAKEEMTNMLNEVESCLRFVYDNCDKEKEIMSVKELLKYRGCTYFNEDIKEAIKTIKSIEFDIELIKNKKTHEVYRRSVESIFVDIINTLHEDLFENDFCERVFWIVFKDKHKNTVEFVDKNRLNSCFGKNINVDTVMLDKIMEMLNDIKDVIEQVLMEGK